MRPKVYRIEDLSIVLFEDDDAGSCPECTCIDDTCVETTICKTESSAITAGEKADVYNLLMRAAAALRKP